MRGLTDATISDDSSFDELYHEMTEILHDATNLHFEQRQSKSQNDRKSQKIRNPTIRLLV